MAEDLRWCGGKLGYAIRVAGGKAVECGEWMTVAVGSVRRLDGEEKSFWFIYLLILFCFKSFLSFYDMVERVARRINFPFFF